MEELNSTSCPGTLERHTYYRFPWRGADGTVKVDLVGVMLQVDEFKEVFRVGHSN